jgi:hypothetical protein
MTDIDTRGIRATVAIVIGSLIISGAVTSLCVALYLIGQKVH